MFTPRTCATGMAFSREMSVPPIDPAHGVQRHLKRMAPPFQGWKSLKRGLLGRDLAARERHFDQGAVVHGAPDLEAGSVGLRQRLGQRQAKPGAAGTPTRRG